MKKFGRTMATLAVASTLGAMAFLPLTAAAQTTTNYYVDGGGYGYGGYGYGGGLGQLFVLGRLFAGPFGNGILSPAGTTLGDLFIVDQLFRGGGYY